MKIRCVVCNKKFEDSLALDKLTVPLCSKLCRLEYEEERVMDKWKEILNK